MPSSIRALRERTDELETSERRYRYLVDHSPDLVWAVDADGRMTYIGETLERLTGYRPTRVMGRYWVDTAHARIGRAWPRQLGEPSSERPQRRAAVPRPTPLAAAAR